MAQWNWTQALVWIVTRDVEEVNEWRNVSVLASDIEAESFALHFPTATEALIDTLQRADSKLVASGYDCEDDRPKLKPISAYDWQDLHVRGSHKGDRAEFKDYAEAPDHVFINRRGIEHFRGVIFRSEDMQRIWPEATLLKASPFKGRTKSAEAILSLKLAEPQLNKDEIRLQLFPTPSTSTRRFEEYWILAKDLASERRLPDDLFRVGRKSGKRSADNVDN